MVSPTEVYNWMKNKIKPIYRVSFLSTVILGLLIHLPIMVRDIPNHDGLDSMYFDQNMITSGRWFLTIACGFSSYFTIPWLISLLGIFFLGITAAFLVAFFRVERFWAGVLIGGLLVGFPSLASTFCYVFTLDGYMMALLFAVLSAYLVEKGKYGFLLGAVFLSLSLGTYQAYLPFAMLLCLFGVYRFLGLKDKSFKEKAVVTGKYVAMGGLGLGLYYGLLQLLLMVQGKQLSNYQGINGMGSVEKQSIVGIMKEMYRNFFAFTLKGNVFTGNAFSKIAMVLAILFSLYLLGKKALKEKWIFSVWFYVFGVLALCLLPIISNIMLLISPGVNYHILMRYHYVLYPIVAVAVLGNSESKRGGENKLLSWIGLLTGVSLTFTYVVTDQIAYSNLEKKYEKTYAYCNRLLTRIEETPGYYQGIPIAMVGVVGNEAYPVTDLTGFVTDGMIGMDGDYLLYTGQNYQAFIENYLGASLNILPADAMKDAYYMDFYMEMESFPGESSIRIVDGIMYIKTENKNR